MTKKKIEFIGRSKTLSKDERDILIEELITRAFKKRFENIDKEKTKLADYLYGYYLKPIQSVIKKLPDRYVGVRSSFEAQSEGDWSGRLSLKTSFEFTVLVGIRILPEFPKEDKEPRKRLEKLSNKQKTLQNQKNIDRAKTKGAIYAVNTTKQLFEQWPEAYSVYLDVNPNFQNDQYLPAIPRDDLNKLLGLP